MQTLQHHLGSALQTFVAGFAIGVVAYIHIYPVMGTIDQATIFAIILAGVRAGVKVLWENIILPWANSTDSTRV